MNMMHGIDKMVKQCKFNHWLFNLMIWADGGKELFKHMEMNLVKERSSLFKKLIVHDSINR